MQDRIKNTVRLFDKFAQVYQEKYMDQQLYAASLDRFCKLIEKEGARILELACGPGNITRYLLGQQPAWQILGTDLASGMIELARANNPTAQFKLLDCRKILELNTQFDGLMCGFAFPYLSKQEAIQLIADARVVLHSGGIFYLSTMEGNYEESRLEGPSSGGEEKIFMHYHESGYLEKALIENGFDLLAMERIDQPERVGPSSNDLILIARKQGGV